MDWRQGLDLKAQRAPAPAPAPLLLATCKARGGDGGGGGGSVTLCDFASAGAAGNAYASWLPADDAGPVPFARDNPWRLAPRG